MSSDKDAQSWENEFNAVVISYLNGQLDFDGAAERLASLYMSAGPRASEEMTQEREDIERWGKEAPVLIVHRAFAVATERPSSDHDKIRALIKEALLRCVRCPRCGTRLTPPKLGPGIHKLELACPSCGWDSS